MPNTDQWWSGDTPFPDQEIFVGATEFKDLAGVATFASAGAGLLTLNLASTAAGNFFANITAMLKRTGVFATPAVQQQQFGTSSSLPGPIGSLPNTSDPEGIRGYPPFTAASLPTLVGPARGAVPKGVMINSVDIVAGINTVNASLAQIGLTATNFVNAVAPNVINIITLGANGIPVAFNAQPTRFNIPSTITPYFTVLADTEVILNVKLTAGSGGTVNFYGCVIKASFNFN